MFTCNPCYNPLTKSLFGIPSSTQSELPHFSSLSPPAIHILTYPQCILRPISLPLHPTLT